MPISQHITYLVTGISTGLTSPPRFGWMPTETISGADAIVIFQLRYVGVAQRATLNITMPIEEAIFEKMMLSRREHDCRGPGVYLCCGEEV